MCLSTLNAQKVLQRWKHRKIIKLNEDKIIELATKHGNTTYVNKNESYIAAKGYAIGYHQALLEKNVEIKELASIIKLLLPGIGAISPDNLAGQTH